MADSRLRPNSIHQTVFWIMLCCLLLAVIQIFKTDCIMNRSNSDQFYLPSSPRASSSTSKKAESKSEQLVHKPIGSTAPPKDPDNDFIRKSYCNGKSPCIALLSASHHGGITSLINARTLSKQSPPPKVHPFYKTGSS